MMYWHRAPPSSSLPWDPLTHLELFGDLHERIQRKLSLKLLSSVVLLRDHRELMWGQRQVRAFTLFHACVNH